MCQHGRFVTNRYTRQRFWITCGKCKSCRQEKAAARSSRIRNEYDGKSFIYFVTLTYDRMSVPYFTQEEFDIIKNKPSGSRYGFLSVYRNCSVSWNLSKKKYLRTFYPVKLADVSISLDGYDPKQLRLRWLNKSRGRIGVCYFKDVQDFNKRLRINLIRKGYEQKIRIFDVTEYGGKSLRPHAHLLVFAKDIPQEAFHNAVIASWSYGRRIRNSKSCQLVTDDPAGYVSSYVNCGSKLSAFLADYFPQKHSSSKFFGHNKRGFSLVEIQKKVEFGTLNYFTSRVVKGIPTVFDFPLPKYIVNRWFPLFKGYSRLTSHQVLEFLSRGFDRRYLESVAKQYDLNHPATPIDYQMSKLRKDLDVFIPSDCFRIIKRLNYAYFEFKKVFPNSSYFDYAKAYDNTWKCWKSTCYKYFRQDDTVPDFYKFDNMCMQPEHVQKEYYELGAPSGSPFIVDNNFKPPVVAKTLKMTLMFDKYCKQKDINGFALESSGM